MSTHLTIESVEVKKKGTNARGDWTFSKVKANGKYYVTFLALNPGESANFIIETTQKNGQTEYVIKGYDNASPNPHPQPQQPGLEVHVEALFSRVQAIEQEIEKLKAAQPDPTEIFPQR